MREEELMTEQKLKQAPKGPMCSTATLIALFCFCLVISAISIPGYSRARIRANQRACYANQKTLAMSLEVYKQDVANEEISLDETTRKDLLAKGYIQAGQLIDPGEGWQPSPNYVYEKGKMYCLVHGAIRGSNDVHGLTPYEEMKAAGVTNTELLARAAKKHKSPGLEVYLINPFFDVMLLTLIWIVIRLIAAAGKYARSQYEYVMHGKVID